MNILGLSSSTSYTVTIQSNCADGGFDAATVVVRTSVTNDECAEAITVLSSYAAGQPQDGLVVNNDGVVVGTATVQLAIDPSLNAGLGYRHYSAPVSNSTVADLTTANFAPVVNPSYNTSATPNLEVSFPTVYSYDESRVLLSSNLAPFDRATFRPLT